MVFKFIHVSNRKYSASYKSTLPLPSGSTQIKTLGRSIEVLITLVWYIRLPIERKPALLRTSYSASLLSIAE